MRGMGVREAGYWVLMGAYASSSSLVTAGLISSFLLYVIPTLLGFLFMNGFVKRSFPRQEREQ